MVPAARSGVDHRLPEPPIRIAAIAAGGALGTLARYGIDRWLVPAPLGFPWPTLVVNVLGSFVLGLIMTLMVDRWPPNRFVRPFAAIGFCGGFTTFSAMALEVAQRGQHGRVGAAGLYLVVSVGAAVIAVALGMVAARGRLRPRPGDASVPDPDALGVLAPGPVRGSGPTGSTDNDDQRGGDQPGDGAPS